MTSKMQNGLMGLALAIIVICNILLIMGNLRLRDELDVANKTIVKLQKTAFHDNTVINDSAAPLEIVVYNYSQPTPTQTRGSNEDNASKNTTPGLTPGASLLDLKRKYLGKAAQSEFSLFIFFSPTDCPACLSEASIWQRLHVDGQRLNLQVIGVMNHPHKLEGEQFLKNLGITFPVLFDNTSLLKNKYMIGETPEKILIDSEGKTLLITPGGKTEEQRRAFEESVLKLITGRNLQ